MNLREALNRARELGASVTETPSSGETRVSHPAMAKRLNVNRRRKDACAALRSWLHQLESRATIRGER